MKTYIDPEPLINALKAIQKRSEIIIVDEVLGVLAKYPAADVAEVVRCKNCTNYRHSKIWPDGTRNPCELLGGFWAENEYCSNGEAKHG